VPRLAQPMKLCRPPAVANEFNVTRRTVGRWMDDPALNFPQPMEINGRLYFRSSDIERWKVERLQAFLPPADDRNPDKWGWKGGKIGRPRKRPEDAVPARQTGAPSQPLSSSESVRRTARGRGKLGRPRKKHPLERQPLAAE
jgi:predicted DNA-binding transcriptional regulator AlpA